jgi:hypothetical protein
MRHYVGYHNVEGMGYELKDKLNTKKFGFYSSKALSFLNKTKDQRIWIISGKKEGPKKTYRLHGYYLVKDIEEGEVGYNSFVYGKPVSFPPVVLNGYDWFQPKEKFYYFSLGINEIKFEDVIAGLEHVAAQALK